MGMRPPGPPPGFMPLPMPYSAVLSKPPEISKQAEEGRPNNHCLSEKKYTFFPSSPMTDIDSFTES